MQVFTVDKRNNRDTVTRETISAKTVSGASHYDSTIYLRAVIVKSPRCLQVTTINVGRENW